MSVLRRTTDLDDRAASAAYLPVVMAGTSAVVILPLLLVFWLRAQGLLVSAWGGILVGVAGSLVASSLGAALWKRTSHSSDVLFSDLMLWGWLHRRRSARRVEAATALLDSRGGESSAISGRTLTNERKTALLAGLISDLESRDPYTNGHSRRVARHAADIARRMGLDREAVAKIRAAGAVHDVGKIHTPQAILNKPGALTGEEFAIIERHPVDGTEMVSVLDDPELTAIVRHHHERLDGKGYPDRMAGEEIPLGARILAVADTFDAITSSRPYRRAHTHEEALRILAEGAGKQHDPAAVRAFECCYSGRRTLAVWAVLTHALSRATPAFGAGTGSAGGTAAVGGGGAGLAGMGTAGAWIAAATVAVGGIAITAGVGAPAASGGGQVGADLAAATPAVAAAGSSSAVGSASSSNATKSRPAGRAPAVASRSGRSAPKGPNTVALRLTAAVAAASAPQAGAPGMTGSLAGGSAGTQRGTASSAAPTAVLLPAAAPPAVAPPPAPAPPASGTTWATPPGAAAPGEADRMGDDDTTKKSKKAKAKKARKAKRDREDRKEKREARKEKREAAKQEKREAKQEKREANQEKREAKQAEKADGRSRDRDAKEPKAQKPPEASGPVEAPELPEVRRGPKVKAPPSGADLESDKDDEDEEGD